MRAKCVQVANINPNVIALDYAVCGQLDARAVEIEKELEKGVKKRFDKVTRVHIGDCHAMGQKPITFMRQLIALTTNPKLINSNDYPEDVKKRAKEILSYCRGYSISSYTHPAGIEIIRQQVANFIEERDGGISSDWNNIYLTDGATPAIRSVLQLLSCKVDGKKPGIMIPIPQYPVYSAAIAEFGMEQIDYYLEEETNWSLNTKELQRSYNESVLRCYPRALVVINPGNPTSQVLRHENIVEIIKFAYENNLILLADEVYQDNIYDENSKFYSFKKVMHELGAPYKDMELISFMSTSKGCFGECGIRGGYMELVNMCPQVMAMMYKLMSTALCSNTIGQTGISAMVNPPKPGEPSYQQFTTERNAILSDLKERAELAYRLLSNFEGCKVNIVQGAMYIFPQIAISAKAIKAAEAKNMAVDEFFAFELLESTGICVVPGSGFGQKPNTYHFRSTILLPTEQLKVMLQNFKNFYIEFMMKYK